MMYPWQIKNLLSARCAFLFAASWLILISCLTACVNALPTTCAPAMISWTRCLAMITQLTQIQKLWEAQSELLSTDFVDCPGPRSRLRGRGADQGNVPPDRVTYFVVCFNCVSDARNIYYKVGQRCSRACWGLVSLSPSRGKMTTLSVTWPSRDVTS